ncbi:MAG: hypothetical protein AAFX94_16955 [Myxococcota bacterium]
MSDSLDEEWKELHELKRQGASPETVYVAAQLRGLNAIELIRMTRKLFGLSLVEAKEVSVRARMGKSLVEHQEVLADSLQRALDTDSD